MSEIRGKKHSRRDFIRLAAGAVASGLLFPERALAQPKTLKIAKWAHFVPEFDRWFEDELAGEWGKRHDTQVVVDHVPVEKIGALAAAEVAAREGHDLFMFPWPPAEYQQHAIDHMEIYQTVASKHGQVARLGHRSTFNPKSKKYFAFRDSWMPAPLHFFQDYWAEVDMPLRSEEHTSELQSPYDLVCRLLLEKKKKKNNKSKTKKKKKKNNTIKK